MTSEFPMAAPAGRADEADAIRRNGGTFAVVIPTHNRRDSLLRVLADVRSGCRRAGVSPLLVVVADGSHDGTQEAVRRDFPEARIVEGDGNWWWTRSANEGCLEAMRAGVEAVLLLNNDVSLDDRYIPNLLRAAAANPGAVIGSLNLCDDGRIFFSGASSFRWWSGRLSRYHPFLAQLERPLAGVVPSVVLPGRGLWVPTTVFARIGLFSQKHLIQYKADYDFTLRAHEQRIPVCMCWDAVLRTSLDSSGAGATFTRGTLAGYMRAWLLPYSRNGLLPNLYYYKRHTPWWGWPLLPFVGGRVLVRHLRRFLHERRPPA